MLDWIVVTIVVAIAAVFLARRAYRTLAQQKPGCTCGHPECVLAEQCAHVDCPAGEVQPPRPQGCPYEDEDGVLHPTSLSEQD